MFDSLLSIGGSLLGAAMSGDSAEDAVNAQSEATALSNAELRRQFDQNRRDAAPWRQVGGSAMYRLGDLLGLGGANNPAYGLERYGNGVPVDAFEGIAAQYGDQAPAVMEALARAGIIGGPEQGMRVNVANSDDVQRILSGFQTPGGGGADSGALNRKFTIEDFNADPVVKLGLDYGLSEGTKALERMANARGMRNSGATLKALSKFGQDYAGSKAGESYGRFYADQDRTFNRLAGVSGAGQTAVQNTAAANTGLAQSMAGNTAALGNARGAAAISGGNAWGNAFGGIGNVLNQNTMMELLRQRGGGGNYGNYSGYGGYGGNSNPYLMSNFVE